MGRADEELARNEGALPRAAKIPCMVISTTRPAKAACLVETSAELRPHVIRWAQKGNTHFAKMEEMFASCLAHPAGAICAGHNRARSGAALSV